MSETLRPLSDAPARQRALDPRESFIVQAPAGSGKTELLIQRILALLSRVERPEEILAITFTRKAAGEMRARLLQALEGARAPEPEQAHARTTWHLAAAALENDGRRGWDLLQNPARLGVQTIDGFCASLARRLPWVSRFGAHPAVTEDAWPLYRQAADKVLALVEARGAEGDAARLLLAHLDNRLELLRDLLVGMLARRDQWLRHLVGSAGEEERRNLEGALRSLVESVLADARKALPPGVRAELVPLGDYAGGNLAAEGAQSPVAALAGRRTFPEAAAQDLPAWQGVAELLLTKAGELRKGVTKAIGFPAGPGASAAMKGRMTALLDSLAGLPEVPGILSEVRILPAALYDESQWRVLQALVTLLPRAAAELWLVFRERGEADFIEVARRSSQALGEADRPTDLLLALDSRINHILVDEFQDTSWGQYGLLERLTAGWEAGDGRTLFLVGDPMQSIYRFREAEVGLYLRSRRRGLGFLPLAPLTLSANFRSQEGIVGWVNASFPSLFPAAEDEGRGAVPYAPSEPVRPPLSGEAVTVSLRCGREDREEAAEVVTRVRQAQNEHPEGSCAVLVRSRSHLLEILPALRAAGLSYRAQEIDPLADRPAAQDLVALTRALLHPADRIAWLAVLRAPWCGLTLEDLHHLCGDLPDRGILPLLKDPERLSRLSPEGQGRCRRLLGALEPALAARGQRGLRALVEGAWLTLGGPACLEADGLEDARRLLALLEKLDCGGDLDPFESLAEGLAALFAAPDAGADGSLQVMTMHKAKGLEFDTVILPGLGRAPRQGEKPLLRWMEDPSCGLLLGPIPPLDGESRDPLYDAIGRLEKEKERLETTRLFYVAATRAKRRLHLLGHVQASADGSVRAPAGSLLASAWDALSGHAPPAAETAPEERQAPIAPSPRPLRRLPEGWALPPLAPSAVVAEEPPLHPSDLGGGEGEGGLSLSLEGEEGRHVGTVTHLLLERIVAEGVKAWDPARLGSEREGIARRLARLGIPSERLAETTAKVLRALSTTLGSERGRWILFPHPEGVCELPLSGTRKGRVVHAILDRTFRDEKGCRWVVDYKTSEPAPGEESATFLKREGEHYRGQLAAYVDLLRAFDSQATEVRAALYFPLGDLWWELPQE